MKLIRILVYEGEDEEIASHLKQCFVGPDRPFEPKGVTIREIFRGSTYIPVVEQLDEHGFQGEGPDLFPDS